MNNYIKKISTNLSYIFTDWIRLDKTKKENYVYI